MDGGYMHTLTLLSVTKVISIHSFNKSLFLFILLIAAENPWE